MKKINTYQEALEFMYGKIQLAPFLMFPGTIGLDRTYYALSLLDNPQDKLKVVHLAGTSGKGSTATMTSHLLKVHGFRVGLHISPFLYDIRERFQIDNSLISEKDFLHYFNETSFIYDAVKQKGFGELTYFEGLTVFMFYLFHKKNVDYAVVETGVGGWYDATNTLRRSDKLCLLTKIGKDHMRILGNTLPKIALQKAMIMQKGNEAFSIGQRSHVEQVFKETAKSQGARIQFIRRGIQFRTISIGETGTQFDFTGKTIAIRKLTVPLIGSYQAENAALALSAVEYLSKRDNFPLSEQKVRRGFSRLFFPGRFQIVSVGTKKIIIDGAHNPQKMKAFISNLEKLYPGRKFTFLIAFKEGKDTNAMLKIIASIASHIYISSFLVGGQDLVHRSQNQREIAESLRMIGFHRVSFVENKKQSIIDLIRKTPNDIVITGSLYFIASLPQISSC